MISSDASVDRAAGRGYWTIWGATLLFFAGFYALLVPLPRYLTAVGLPDWQVGLVLGAFGIASLIGRPIAGVAADRWGQRPVLLAGAALLLLGSVTVSLTASVAVLFALRLLQAAGYVAFTTAGTALVVALTPERLRGSRLAIFGAAANVAISITPAVTSALLEVVPLAAGFAIPGALALVAAALATRVSSVASGPAGASGARWSFPRALWLPMAIAALFGAGFAAFFQYAPILAERRAVPAGLLYTVYGAAIITTRFVGGGWLDRAGVRQVLALAAVLMSCGLALAAFAEHPALLSAAALLVALGSGLFHPALIAHHAALLPDSPGRASAGFYVGFDLGIGGGSWLLGALLQLGGLAALYGAASLAVLLTLPLGRLLTRPTAASAAGGAPR